MSHSSYNNGQNSLLPASSVETIVSPFAVRLTLALALDNILMVNQSSHGYCEVVVSEDNSAGVMVWDMIVHVNQTHVLHNIKHGGGHMSVLVKYNNMLV